MIVHAMVPLVGGDDWQLNATMLDPDGNPLDISAATVKWTIVNKAGQPVLGPGDFTINLGAETGTCSVSIPSTTTTRLSGQYTDHWRVVLNGITQTLLCGPISVAADPFAALAVAPSESAGVALLASRRNGRDGPMSRPVPAAS